MVLISGCFDGLHSGHIAYFRAARRLCRPDDILLCSVAPDETIVLKGRRPQWHQADRVAVVHAVYDIDATIAQTSPSVAATIRKYRPRLFVKGTDWDGRIPEDVLEACRATGTIIAFTETDAIHTSQARADDIDADLETFEATMVTQQDLVIGPWKPVTDYSFEARKDIEGRHPDLITEVFRPTFALDVGCGPGHLVRMLCERGIPCVGVDVNAVPPALYLDIAAANMPEKIGERDSRADLVICREVLEHLPMVRVARAVRNLCILSGRWVYVTTRFAMPPASLLQVDTKDSLDPTHITMFNQQFLRALFVLAGFRRNREHEKTLDWQHKGRCLVYERLR